MALVAALSLLSSSCGSRKLAYNFASIFLLRQLDNAFDLSPAQKDYARPRLRRLIEWHRHEELPLYAARLEALRVRLTDGLTPEDLSFAREVATELWRRAAQKVAPVAAEFFVTLRPEQVEHFAQALLREDPDRGRPPAQALARRISERSRSIEGWLGPLSPAQRELVAAFEREGAADHHARKALVRERQADFAAILRRAVPSGPAAHPMRTLPALTEDVRAFLLRDDETDSAGAARAVATRMHAREDQLALGIMRLATPVQRQHLDAEIVDLRDDLLELSRER